MCRMLCTIGNEKIALFLRNTQHRQTSQVFFFGCRNNMHNRPTGNSFAFLWRKLVRRCYFFDKLQQKLDPQSLINQSASEKLSTLLQTLREVDPHFHHEPSQLYKRLNREFSKLPPRMPQVDTSTPNRVTIRVFDLPGIQAQQFGQEFVDAIEKGLMLVTPSTTLIIDLRNNGGGSSDHMLAAFHTLLARCGSAPLIQLSDRKHVVRATYAIQSFPPHKLLKNNRIVEPSLVFRQFQCEPRRVVLLVGKSTASAGEWLALVMQRLPQCHTCGSPTAGQLGQTDYAILPNGDYVQFTRLLVQQDGLIVDRVRPSTTLTKCRINNTVHRRKKAASFTRRKRT